MEHQWSLKLSSSLLAQYESGSKQQQPTCFSKLQLIPRPHYWSCPISFKNTNLFLYSILNGTDYSGAEVVSFPLRRFFRYQSLEQPYFTVIPLVSEECLFQNTSTFDFQPGYQSYFFLLESKMGGDDNKKTPPLFYTSQQHCSKHSLCRISYCSCTIVLQ